MTRGETYGALQAFLVHRVEAFVSHLLTRLIHLCRQMLQNRFALFLNGSAELSALDEAPFPLPKKC